MNNEDLIDGLHVIARRRGQKIQQGDVEFVEAAIQALAKRTPVAEERRSLEALQPTEIELAAATALNEYLLAHEDDIAAGINDFAVLRATFLSCIHREPALSGPHGE